MIWGDKGVRAHLTYGVIAYCRFYHRHALEIRLMYLIACTGLLSACPSVRPFDGFVLHVSGKRRPTACNRFVIFVVSGQSDAYPRLLCLASQAAVHIQGFKIEMSAKEWIVYINQ